MMSTENKCIPNKDAYGTKMHKTTSRREPDRPGNFPLSEIMMKTRLSALNYVKNNKKSVAVLVTALVLSFAAMYLIHVLLQTTPESFKKVMFEMPKKLSFASLTGKAYGLDRSSFETYEAYEEAYMKKQEDLIGALKKDPGIEDAVYTQILKCKYQSVIGEYYYELPLLSPAEIPGFLDHCEAELIDGRMPEGDGEILVDEVILKNAGLKTGDWFRREAYGEVFRIVGSIRSDALICVGTPMGYTNNGWYLTVYNDETVTDLKAILEREGIVLSSDDEIIDSVSYRETFKTEVEDVINTVILSISLVVTIFLALLVLVAYVSFLRNRVNEYCLYASIGYGRSDIYGMILREMLLLFAIGTLIGLILSLGAGFIITKLLITPKGLIGKLFYGDRILQICGIFIFLMGLLQIPVLVYAGRIKTIDAIEE